MDYEVYNSPEPNYSIFRDKYFWLSWMSLPVSKINHYDNGAQDISHTPGFGLRGAENVK